MYRWLLSLLTVITFVVAACGGVRVPRSTDTFSCDDITAAPLRSLLKETMSPEAIRERMAVLYQVPVEKVEYGVNPDRSAYVEVIKDGVTHTLDMKGSRPTSVRVLFEARMPSGAKVTQCLGEPRWYWANYFFGPTGADHALRLSMFIPVQGAWIEAGTYGKDKRPPPLDGSIPVIFVQFIVPSSNEATTMEQLLEGIGPDLRKQVVSQIKPWPGKWESIQVEIDPALQ